MYTKKSPPWRSPWATTSCKTIVGLQDIEMPRMLSGRGGMARFQIALFSSRHCFSTWPLVLKFSTFQPERVYNGLRIISKLFIVGSLTNLSYFAESGV